MIVVASGQNTACSEALTEDICSYQLSSYQLSADSLYWWSMLPVLRMLVQQQALTSAEDSSISLRRLVQQQASDSAEDSSSYQKALTEDSSSYQGEERLIYPLLLLYNIE